MAGKGPAPKPTAQLKLSGSPIAEKRVAEPQYDVEAPEPPAWLTDEAVAHWREIVPRLERQGLVHMVCVGTLAALCQSYADMVELRELVKEEGWSSQGARGKVRNPVGAAYAEARTAYLRYAQDFGLSPSSKTRVHASESGGQSKASKFGFGSKRV